MNVFSYILELLKVKKTTRRLLYFFIFLLLLSGLLDNLSLTKTKGTTLELFGEFLMVVGASGFSITIGTLLHFAVSSQEETNSKYHLISVAWILGGIGFILSYLAIKLIQAILV